MKRIIKRSVFALIVAAATYGFFRYFRLWLLPQHAILAVIGLYAFTALMIGLAVFVAWLFED